ncbi:hypothetical protein [Nibricoccus sp. IMCC34717]|uniref:hypothetical protein n=1 Tax=Nibricoccus sp. IMCC34717 TaxID=3034021 RepID=UPI0038503720
MKRYRLLLVLPLAALLFGGCATPLETRSAGHVVIPGNTQLGQTTWTPSDSDIRDIETEIAFLFNNPDERITGLGETPPPYPLSDYMIRYTVAGPVDQPYVLGEAVHRTRPEAATQLNPNAPGFDPKKARGPMYFTFLYNVKTNRIRELHFPPQ